MTSWAPREPAKQGQPPPAPWVPSWVPDHCEVGRVRCRAKSAQLDAGAQLDSWLLDSAVMEL